MVKQLHELGYEGLTVGGGQVPPVCLEIAGKEALEGHYYNQATLDFASDVASPAQKAFAEQYKYTYAESEIPVHAEKNYDMTIGIIKAIEKANTLDTTVVRDALEEPEWELLSGDMSKWGGLQRYGINHQLIHTLYVSQVRDGKVVTVGSAMVTVP